MAANISKPLKLSYLHFLLASLVGQFWPHNPPHSLSPSVGCKVKKQHRLNHLIPSEIRKWVWFMLVSVHVYIFVCELRPWEQGAGYCHPCLVGEGAIQWFFQGFFLNAEFIRSGRVLPTPTGSLEESQISREMYKMEAGSPLKTQLGLLHPVYRLSNRGKKAQRMLTWLDSLMLPHWGFIVGLEGWS